MSAAATVERLFRMPGDCRAGTTHLLAQAAAAHARLLASTPEPAANGRLEPLRPLQCFLKGHAAAAQKRRLLDDPLLVEALHALAAESGPLGDWDQTVATRADHNGSMPTAAAREPADADRSSHGRALLGNLALAVLLREQPQWQGEIELSSDGFGSLRFPFSDWTVRLFERRADEQELLADEAVVVSLDAGQARWRLAAADTPFLVLSRDDLRRMLLDDDVRLDARHMHFPHATVRPRLVFTAALGASGIHYDAVAASDAAPSSAAHAATTGAILAALLGAIRHSAPAIYRQMCAYIRTIRGFELPAAADRLLESYSTPLSPGVIGFNVSYNGDDQPLLCPFCFTWLGHELGHTLHYLIDDAAWLHGETFVANAGETTPVIARYGRSLPVRTLFQIPYVHLYEWALLMDFYQAGFAGLPWNVDDDAVAFGDDLRAEIAEAFDLIVQYARLTPLGVAAVAHLRRLTGLAAARWRRVVQKKYQEPFWQR